MISRQARKALRNKRQGKQCGYVEVLKQGQKAFLSGDTLRHNPYQAGTEDAETWAEGYIEAQLIGVKV